PELALRARALRGLRGVERMRVRGLQREMSKREAHLIREALHQQLDRGERLLASRALEVAVLDHHDRGVWRSQYTARGSDGLYRAVHCPSPLTQVRHSVSHPRAAVGAEFGARSVFAPGARRDAAHHATAIYRTINSIRLVTCGNVSCH